MVKALDFIDVPPKIGETATGLIVILHGWGANAEDVASIVPFLQLPQYHFVFPNAPFPHPHSQEGRAWYDLSRDNMYEGLVESRKLLIDYLQSLENSTGIPLKRTILSGFSQGGAMTLDVGLKLPVAGLISMSGYLHSDIQNIETPATNFLAPVLIMHGKQDQVVPLQAAQKARDALELKAVPLEYREFDGGHQISSQMLDVARTFVLGNLT
ncbi:alpha/beta hydrolase [Rivularia sp. UHCC 0363]|uniref:alpha/beta hydrolase n=1 Tax=Rivularia sp. UHCC 0363 TaxID=3110244 RepID=UPI002B1FED19|nr:dienelactone hydrolase family protein [Rivularia sp. UHCC 0363]MEA5593380.1 dienelactone hydrolase family protein [Rivularia sp. UHCC 0363]